MAKRLQHRGGTTSQHSTFTGAVREVTVDTDKNTLVVHDGATAGGHPLATATNFTSTGIDDNATSTAITIDSSERVGIGTGSPQTNLHIYQVTAPAKIRLERSGSNSNDGELGEIEFFNNDGSNDTPAVTAKITASADSPAANGSGGNLRFFTHDGTEGGEGSSPVERVRIDGSGNVGIGTSAPTGVLTVSGFNAHVDVTNSSNSSVALLGSSGSTGDAPNRGYLRLRKDGSTNDGISLNANGNSWINNGGNVGIGTNSPSEALDVNGRIKNQDGVTYPLFLARSFTGLTTGTNSLGQINGWCGIIFIKSNHNTYIPFYTRGGGGVAWKIFWGDPDTGFTTGNSFTYTEAGSNTNTYSISMSSGSGNLSIGITSGSTTYNVSIYRWNLG